MFLADTHTHSYHSLDGSPEATVERMCEAAIAAGLSELAVTDHYECVYMREGFYSYLDLEKREKDILAAKEKFQGKLIVTYGIELGQPTFDPDEAKDLISSHNFDFVIGSLHTVPNIRDIYYENFVNYSDFQIKLLWEKYLDELKKHVLLGGFDSIGHITYPRRYIVRAGRQSAVNPAEYKDRYAELFELIIEKGFSLECNSSGLRQGLGTPMPDYELMKLYHDLGGTMVTLGSDAHYLEHIGSGIAEAAGKMLDIGFKYLTVYRQRRPYMIKIK
ncbi:MAG: histidinol-phosphatase HisJ family protein [Eubacteriales bacterium]|nr:histidinol-phosphatase HisJ family protein [Eubacteriales bacterium]MDD4476336.1 histidinol-phosphatase HisJ family protein [Eubacteriales bacterium]